MIDASVCKSDPCLLLPPPNKVEKISPPGPNRSPKSPELKPWPPGENPGGTRPDLKACLASSYSRRFLSSLNMS